MKRKIEEKLLEWKNDPHRKPLLLLGARQVGKTYIVKDVFGPQNFRKVIYVDFRVDAQSRRFVKNHPDAKSIIEYLSLKWETSIDENTLLFFDEIQEAVQILTAAKYFCQDFPLIPVVMTGSLVRVKLKQLESEHGSADGVRLDFEIEPKNQDGHNNFLFPVGKLDQIDLCPMTFDEFLFAAHPRLYEVVKKASDEKKPLEDETHNLAMECFFDYLQVGGMPEAVALFLETKSAMKAQQVSRRIANDYLADMGLYQLSSQAIFRSRMVYENIYAQLNKENKNYKIAEIEKGKRLRDYLTPFDWLSLSRLIYRSFALKERVSLPLCPDNESIFRIYLPDCGLFANQSGINLASFQESLKNNTLSGVFMENYVACELKARGIPLFFWKGKTSSEFEFILSIGNDIVPLDVKKNRGSLKSLSVYRQLNRYSYSLKVSQNRYGYDEVNKIETIPFYAFPFYLEALMRSGKL